MSEIGTNHDTANVLVFSYVQNTKENEIINETDLHIENEERAVNKDSVKEKNKKKPRQFFPLKHVQHAPKWMQSFLF